MSNVFVTDEITHEPEERDLCEAATFAAIDNLCKTGKRTTTTTVNDGYDDHTATVSRV